MKFIPSFRYIYIYIFAIKKVAIFKHYTWQIPETRYVKIIDKYFILLLFEFIFSLHIFGPGSKNS